MSRWIDADRLLEARRMKTYYHLKNGDTAIPIIDIKHAPSIDLVRCKECKKAHLTYDGDCKYCDEWKDNDGNYIEVYHDGNHYCSYGERKEDNE